MNYIRSKFNILKVLISILLLILLSLSVNYYINYNYSNLLNTFYSEFNQCKFEEAKETLSDNSIVLKLKKKSLNNDLTNYFTSIISNISTDLKNNKITSSQAVSIFKEMKSYNVLNSSLDKLILTLDEDYVLIDSTAYKTYLDLAIDKYNSGNFTGAINMLIKIPYSQGEYYSTAQSYIEKCKAEYKTSLFKEADELVADDYYTKAIELLSDLDTSIVSSDDTDIANKISSIEIAREEYLDSQYYIDNAQSTSNTILETITFDNINTLNIESSTPYLIYVNLNDQKTYVYSGSSDNWSLEKSLDCSTGIEGSETPIGIYTVTNRGDWFYSEEYEQGGKYWVQFWGDYLFHSLPFDETQSEVLDYTLGVPSSHGCIRLTVEDSKWLYDNMPDDTKIIIN